MWLKLCLWLMYTLIIRGWQLLYKQQFGVSCMDDVIDFRLRKAKDLLAYTGHSIAEIAEQCGYKNTEHFCRQFRKNAGTTPGRFRKEPR